MASFGGNQQSRFRGCRGDEEEVWPGSLADLDFELQLVVDVNAVVADLWDARLHLASSVNRTGVDSDNPQTTPLIEPHRVEVVVGRCEPDALTATRSSSLDDRGQQGGSHADAFL